MLSTLVLYLCLTANPAPKFGTAVQQADSVAILSRTWVLREQFHAHNGKVEPVSPHETIEMTLRENGTYTLNRHQGVPGAGTVEEGRWEPDTARGTIRMQTRQVNGGAMLSTMLPRWEIRELTKDRLVLRLFAMSGTYLVLEAEK